MFYMMIKHFQCRRISFSRYRRLKFVFSSFLLSGCWRKILMGKKNYLRGFCKYDHNTCILALIAKAEHPLRCFHKKADDRITYHLNHTVRIQKCDNHISRYRYSSLCCTPFLKTVVLLSCWIMVYHSLSELYHGKKFHFDLEKFLTTSECMKQHIWCA